MADDDQEAARDAVIANAVATMLADMDPDYWGLVVQHTVEEFWWFVGTEVHVVVNQGHYTLM